MSKTYQERFRDFRLKSACGQVWLSLAADIAAEADATIDRLTAERDAAREDAKRYHWLRSNAYIELACDSPKEDLWKPEALDKEVDAAIAKDKP